MRVSFQKSIWGLLEYFSPPLFFRVGGSKRHLRSLSSADILLMLRSSPPQRFEVYSSVGNIVPLLDEQSERNQGPLHKSRPHLGHTEVSNASTNPKQKKCVRLTIAETSSTDCRRLTERVIMVFGGRLRSANERRSSHVAG
ncbi:hypothetical protein TNCV_397901 [Trichonephila clavipes]|nr:hypothetical protein TNCV_397901 [Trichonephila clavipes]